MKKFSMILEELFEAKNTSRKKPAADDDDADDFEEGTKEVYAFVIYTDSKDNRFFLNKNKRAFTKFDPKDVFSVSLGQAKNAKKLTPQERMKILKQIPDHIGKIDKFEDDVAVMDQFELEGAPASWQPGNSTDESLIEAKEREIIPKALVDKSVRLNYFFDLFDHSQGSRR